MPMTWAGDDDAKDDDTKHDMVCGVVVLVGCMAPRHDTIIPSSTTSKGWLGIYAPCGLVVINLHANVVRFDRPPKYASRSSHPVNPKPANHVSPVATSFVSAVKGNSSPFVSKPALTKHEENILESFKIIVKGKVFCVRAKELFVWNSTFKDIPETVHCSDDESIKGEAEMNGEDSKLNNDGDASDSEVVSNTYFGDNADEQGYENEQGQSFNAKEVSKDPFNIYDLLNKTKKVVGTSGSDTSLPYPPGFTPDKSTNVINEKEVSDAAEVRSNSKSDGGNSRILEEVENIDGCFSSEGRNIGVKPKEGGSILEILDEMIKVGQTMGFSMEGCTKDMENIIGSKGVYEILR
ncbi:hypothetical protein Tco_0721629 [Tanacetum coccineum]